MFKLLRYYSIASLIALLVISVLIATIARRVIYNNRIEIGQNKNIALAQSITNIIWPEFGSFLTSAGQLTPAMLRDHPEMTRLNRTVLNQTAGLSLVRVKIYDLDGITVFSSEAAQIGQNNRDDPGFQAALAGQIRSELTHRDTFSAFEGTIEDRDVLASYIPIRPDGPGGPVEGVLEVYDDVTHFLQQIDRAQLQLGRGMLATLLLLYGILFLIVRRADGIIREQYQRHTLDEQALHESREQFRQFVSSISHHVYVTEYPPDGAMINRYISPNVEELTGYPLRRFETDWSFWPTAVIHPQDREAAAAQAQRFARGEDSEMEYRLVREDGQIIWVRDSGRVEHNPDGAGFVIYGVVSDITQRKLTEEALFESEAENRAILQAMPDMIFRLYRDGTFLDFIPNKSVAPWLPVQEMLGRNIAEVLPTMGDQAKMQIEQAFQMYDVQVFEYQFHQDGRVIWVEARIAVLGSEEVLAIVRDVTARKQAEVDLAQARDEALEASRLKGQLLANVSHDLRTPLNAILGYTEMLYEGVYGSLSEEQHDVTRKIMISTVQMLDFVSNLLGQAHLEAGRVRLNLAHFPPDELLEGVQAALHLTAQAKGIALAGDLAPDVPPLLYGDPYWLRQIMANLISNAVKFTDQGSVHIHIYIPDPEHWAFQVSDTGCGIPAEAQDYVFDSFRQVDSTITRTHGGSGLGLSIVRQLTQLMAGKIDLVSEVNRGTTVTVTLPLQTVAEEVQEML